MIQGGPGCFGSDGVGCPTRVLSSCRRVRGRAFKPQRAAQFLLEAVALLVDACQIHFGERLSTGLLPAPESKDVGFPRGAIAPGNGGGKGYANRLSSNRLQDVWTG